MRALFVIYGFAVLACLSVTLAILFGCVELHRPAEPPVYQPPPALMQADRTWLVNHAYQVEFYDPAAGEWFTEVRHLTQPEAMEAARRLRREKTLETIATKMGDNSEIVAWYRP